MSTNISRRTLAKGAAWAAPVVAATAAVPAYAASPICPDDINQQVQAQFDAYAATLPDLTGGTLRFYWQDRVGTNGSVHTSNLMGALTGVSEWDIATFPFVFEFAQRNVATSPAVNTVLGGKSGVGMYNGAVMPDVWPGNTEWNTTTGAVSNENSTQVDTPTGNQRDVSHATGFFGVYTSDGHYNSLSTSEFGEETGTPQDTHLLWTLALNNKDLAKGNYVELLNSFWRDATLGDKAIYAATGFRPVGFLPPSLDSIKNTLDPKGEYTDNCIEVAYDLAISDWFTSKKPFGGLEIVYGSWGSGVINDVTYTGTDFVWSHVTGAFPASQTTNGYNLGSVGQGGDPFDFFDQFLVGLPNGQNTSLGRQVMYSDGIW